MAEVVALARVVQHREVEAVPRRRQRPLLAAVARVVPDEEDDVDGATRRRHDVLVQLRRGVDDGAHVARGDDEMATSARRRPARGAGDVLVAAPVQHGAVGRGKGRQEASHLSRIVGCDVKLTSMKSSLLCASIEVGQLDEVSDEDLAKQKLSTT